MTLLTPQGDIKVCDNGLCKECRMLYAIACTYILHCIHIVQWLGGVQDYFPFLTCILFDNCVDYQLTFLVSRLFSNDSCIFYHSQREI